MPRCLTCLVIAVALTAAPSAADGDEPAAGAGWSAPQPVVTIRPHAYTLAECLALAERNFPNLWAARARLAQAHAQLDEARWTPWFQWSAHSDFGVAPPLLGTVLLPQSTLTTRDINDFGNLQPFFGFGISGAVPLYTFGKIEAAQDAA